jgi:hypothetical protein
MGVFKPSKKGGKTLKSNHAIGLPEIRVDQKALKHLRVLQEHPLRATLDAATQEKLDTDCWPEDIDMIGADVDVFRMLSDLMYDDSKRANEHARTIIIEDYIRRVRSVTVPDQYFTNLGRNESFYNVVKQFRAYMICFVIKGE